MAAPRVGVSTLLCYLTEHSLLVHMSKAEILERVRALSREEQLVLAEQIWAEQGDDANEPPEFLAELERRASEFKRNPGEAIPWDEIRAEVAQRFTK